MSARGTHSPPHPSAQSPADELSPAGSGSKLKVIAGVLVALGAALCLASLWDEGNRTRFSFAYLWGFSFVWAIVLGSLFFVALQHLTGAVWSIVIRRVAEMLASSMWLVAILFLPLLVFLLMSRQFPLFPWADEAALQDGTLLHGKEAYLNIPFFALRAAVFFVLWIGFTVYFVGTSLRQDRGEAGAEASASMRKVAAPFMIVFAFTTTFAGIDWMMSLDPHWFSTMFGVYIFSGVVVASLSAITIATVLLRGAGRLGRDIVTEEHLYSLGALLFAFVCFWGYIAFSQYMLIWYANMPEETGYFFRRLQGGWLGVSVALAFARFAIPFFVLLSRRSKMNPRTLLWVSVFLLGGQLLDLYWVIMPQLHVQAPQLGWQELGPPMFITGAALLHTARFMGRHRLMAVRDPLLDESIGFHL